MAAPALAAMPPAPDARVKITAEYAKHIGRDAYFWVWPMVNVYNRRRHFSQVKETQRSGPLMQAPLNRLAMLTDYVAPEERSVACPNQDVVYGIGSIALDISPVVVQVPDFGDRFWVYQIVDLRTDSFVQLGKMYSSTPGFYLLVGPDWQGDVPKGITKVFRSPTTRRKRRVIPTSAPTGCRRRKATSRFMSVPTGRKRRSPKAAGRRRPSSRRHDFAPAGRRPEAFPIPPREMRA